MRSSRLTPAQAAKFGRLRLILVICILGAAASLLATVALFLVPSAGHLSRAIAAGIFVECAASAAVLGAFAPCPVCRARLGSEPGRLLPASCPKCKVLLRAESGEPEGDSTGG